MKKASIRALAAGVAASVAMTCFGGFSVSAAQAVGEAAQAVMPTRTQAIEALEKANDYWITNNRNHGRAFWDNAAYHVGNMEAYFTTGIEVYRNYSEAWSTQNNWKGATSDNRSGWRGGASTGGYGEGQEWVLFGDWQICFQTYIDLYNAEVMESQGKIKDDNKVARAIEVMSYQMSRPEKDWWWWADSLFMAMPIMSKLYVLTGDYQYLDKQYEWFKWAAEDVEGGTKDGMWDEEYRLFHRDGKYIYPDHKTDNGKKNFWARGSGWVFAGLARVLSDMPTDYEHRDYFLDKYTQMASGVKDSQQPEGFWSRSMIDRPYADGFEASGTAFFTYGLAWGINSGYLDRATYLDTCLKGWYFLSNTALQSDGCVGYIQPIGENPKQSLGIGGRNSANFGVGAFLLAASEVSRLAGGVYGDKTNNNDIYPYIMRKLVDKNVIEVNTAHFYHDGIINHHDEKNHDMQTYRMNNTVMLPLIAINNYMENCTVAENGDTVTVTRTVKNGNSTTNKTVVLTVGSTSYTVNGAQATLPEAVERKNGYVCAPVRQVMEGLGYKVWYSAYDPAKSTYVSNYPMDALVVISDKVDPFFDCDANAVEMLRWMLEVNHHYPDRPAQTNRGYTVEKPQSASKTAIGTQIPLTAAMVSASATPEPENNAAQTVDNNVQTRWAAKGSQYMTIDLGSAKQIACVGVRMMQYTDGRVINYGIQYSTDGVNYTTKYGALTSAPNGAVWEFPRLDGVQARYIRITVNGSSTGEWASVADVAVFQGDANSPETTVAGGTGGAGAANTTSNSATGTKVNLTAGMLSAQTHEAENPPASAIDGNVGTWWAAAKGSAMTIDLGSAQVVSSVGVRMRQYDDGRTVNYGVSVSADGRNYTSYFSGSCPSGGGVMEYIPIAANARYIKIDTNGNSVSDWASVAEIEVYTGGTAQPGPTASQGVGTITSTMSSTPTGTKMNLTAGMLSAQTHEAENPPASAIDGNNGTWWAASRGSAMTIDLGSSTGVTSVGVRMRQYDDGRTVNYGVSVSADGSNYVTLFSGSCAAGGGVAEYHSVGANVRYVKIDTNGNSVSDWASVAEVEVYTGTVSGSVGGATGPAQLSTVSSKPVGNAMTLKSAGTAITVDAASPASSAIDGNYGTSWKGNANHSIVVEANLVKTITSVGVRMNTENVSYSISISEDGTTWTPIYNGPSAAGSTAYYPCQVKGKFVMVTLADEGRISEIELYGAE